MKARRAPKFSPDISGLNNKNVPIVERVTALPKLVDNFSPSNIKPKRGVRIILVDKIKSTVESGAKRILYVKVMVDNEKQKIPRNNRIKRSDNFLGLREFLEIITKIREKAAEPRNLKNIWEKGGISVFSVLINIPIRA